MKDFLFDRKSPALRPRRPSLGSGEGDSDLDDINRAGQSGNSMF